MNSANIFVSCDRWTLLAGQKWLQRIHEELDSARVIICLVSKNSVDRPWINFEAGAAWIRNTPIIPACFGGLEKGSLNRFWSDFHQINIPDDAEELIAAVCHHVVGQVMPSVVGLTVGKYLPGFKDAFWQAMAETPCRSGES